MLCDTCETAAHCINHGCMDKPRQSALNKQVAGNHYKDLPIQPVEYIHSNGLTYLAGNVVKYISRHKSKGGAADVRKAIHYCELILELEYSNGKVD